MTEAFGESFDTSTMACALTQWWTPSLLQSGDLPPPDTRKALYLKHMVLNPIHLNLSLASFHRDLSSSPRDGDDDDNNNGGSNDHRGPLSSVDDFEMEEIGLSSTPSSPGSGPGHLGGAAAAAGGGILNQAVSVSLGALGSMLSSLTRAPIRLAGLELVNVLASGPEIGSRLGAHYMSASFSALATSLGSLDVLGSPLQVVSALGTGMRDFFVEPMEASTFLGFGSSLAVGSVSLLGNTVAGVGLGVSSITSSVARSLSALAFDDDFVRGRAERGATGAGGVQHYNNAALGLLAGTRELGRGIAQGVAGVVLEPMRGAEAGGVGGFIKGLGKGVAGLIVKPVTGVLDFTQQTTDGLIASAKQMTRAIGGTAAHGGAPSSEESLLGSRRVRHRRLHWGLQRSLIPIEPNHAAIKELIRAALETELEENATKEAQGRASRMKRVLEGGQREGLSLFGLGSAAGTQTTEGEVPPPTLTKQERPGQFDLVSSLHTSSIARELHDLLHDRDTQRRNALATSDYTYLFHVSWPRSPYVTVFTTRSVIQTRIGRVGVGGGGGANTGGSTSASAAAAPTTSGRLVSICWSLPVDTPLSRAAIAYSFTPAVFEKLPPSSKRLLLERSGITPSGGGGGGGSGALQALLLFHHLLDCVDEACSAAALARSATVAQNAAQQTTSTTSSHTPVVVSSSRAGERKGVFGTGGGVVGSGGGVGVTGSQSYTTSGLSGGGLFRSGPGALLLYDGLVQNRFSSLAGAAPSNPLFGLSRRLVDAMIVFTEPRPLHFGDAAATLCNIRPDEQPSINLAAIVQAANLMNSAYVSYCHERAAYLRENPRAPGAGEAGSLLAVRGLDPRDITPLFNFTMCRTAIDRPLLCLVLATMWYRHSGDDAKTSTSAAAGLSDSKNTPLGGGALYKDRTDSERALAAFSACCEWAAALEL